MTRKLITCLLASALLGLWAGPAAAQADFGISSAKGSLTDPAGQPLFQAGAHPDLTTEVHFNTTVDPEIEQPAPDGNPKDIEVSLPPGLIGNPTATPKCSQGGLLGGGFVANCSPSSQVGVATVTTYFFGPAQSTVPVYNVEPPPGVAGEFGFNLLSVLVLVDATVGNDGEYHLQANISNVSQGLALGDTSLTLWGIPASSTHDAERAEEGKPLPPEVPTPSGAEAAPLISNPTSCSGSPLRTGARADSWQAPGVFDEASFEADAKGNPMLIEGCDEVPFEASFEAQPTSHEAESPSGLDVDLTIPQNRFAEGLSAATLRKAVVTLPEGMTINPSSAGGLGSCSPQQIDLGGEAPASCPASSKIGSVLIDSPLLDTPLRGGVFLARQGQNEFGSLLAIYLAVDDPQTGVVLKLPGKVETDPSSGRLVATFDDQPQLPFQRLEVSFFGGPRAALMTPPACGTYSTVAEMTPWSGTAPVTATDSFRLTTGPGGGPCPDGGFDPKLEAGTASPVGGEFSPFVLRLSRGDGTQRLSSLDVTLPRGLLAKLAGIPYCADAALAAVPSAEGTGTAQLANPSCPAASQVGTVSVTAGAGGSPFAVRTGRAYLAGPYKGAPLSLAIVTPALAGPFDLGNVVVRTALRVDPETSQVSADSDPLPTILHGIPLDLREVQVSLDRAGFTLNPTSCAAQSVDARVVSVAGATASPSEPFRAAACRGLGFSPQLSLKLKGGTRRSAYPALTATLKAKRGEANIRRVQVQLPHSEFLAQEHIGTVCTRVQFRADSCPAASVYGYAEARTPLLGKPLRGPVYLRSSSHPLPDLVAALRGQIEIDLVGRIDSHEQSIRTTFATVPDAPISSFVLRMRGGKRGLLVNSRRLCGPGFRAAVRMDAHNGKVHDSNPVLQSGC